MSTSRKPKKITVNRLFVIINGEEREMVNVGKHNIIILGRDEEGDKEITLLPKNKNRFKIPSAGITKKEIKKWYEKLKKNQK